MAWKLLRLMPLKPFFFGKETIFTNTNYASSEYFPQQTQITGALRLYWMEQNKLMKVHKTGRFCTPDRRDKAQDLVGNAGSSNFETNDNLGKINFLSPMFITKTSNKCVVDALFEIPSDIVKIDCEFMTVIPKKLDNITSHNTTVFLENYNVKEGFVSGFGGVDFWNNYRQYQKPKCIYKHDEIFEAYEQVGIGLEDNKQVEEGKFYTKKSYMLNSGYEFGLLIDIDEKELEEKEKLQDGIITLGAENSVFNLKVSDIPPTIKQHPIIQNFQNDTESFGRKIVLLSDSMLDSSINENAFYQIVPHKVPFKMMESVEEGVKTVNGTAFKVRQRSQSDKKSKEKLLVPKGSIYYFTTPSSLQKAKGAYAKMGFNHYLVLN